MKHKNNIIHGIEAKKSRSVTGQDDRVRCLTLNFFSYKMLIPNASVAEVTELSNIQPLLGAPEWFGGMMTWREQDVPVVIFEKVMNIAASKPQKYLLSFHCPWLSVHPQFDYDRRSACDNF